MLDPEPIHGDQPLVSIGHATVLDRCIVSWIGILSLLSPFCKHALARQSRTSAAEQAVPATEAFPAPLGYDVYDMHAYKKPGCVRGSNVITGVPTS